MKKQQFKKFIDSWNSEALISNLSFTLKLHQFGITYSELTNHKKVFGGCTWNTPYGLLEDIGGILSLDETKIPVLTDIVATNEMNQFDVEKIINGEKIALFWCVKDVLWRAKEKGISISEAQAKIILALIKRNHDEDLGVSWKTIDAYLQNLERECQANV